MEGDPLGMVGPEEGLLSCASVYLSSFDPGVQLPGFIFQLLHFLDSCDLESYFISLCLLDGDRIGRRITCKGLKTLHGIQ